MRRPLSAVVTQGRSGRAGSLLPAAGERLRAIVASHPMVADTALALGVLLVCVPGLAEARLDDRPLRFLIVLSLALPLVFRRRAPSGTFVVIAAVAFAQWLADIQVLGDIALLIALYTVAVHAPRRRALLAAGVLELGAVLVVARWASESAVSAFLGLSAFTSAALVLGINVGNRRLVMSALEERAARLESERDQQGRLAAAAERSRIAREMHDIVAHSLTVVIALADGAVYAAEHDPARARQAMETVSATGREALGEMRRLLGVLRDEEQVERYPQPGLAELEGLVEQVRAAGLPVTLIVSGDVARLPPGLQLTAFRIVQEALTNTLKHARGAPSARISVRATRSALELEILDDGEGGGAPADADGRGLHGMRERATVFGGTVDVGPAPGGGWRVAAQLDVDPAELALS